jgi:hypothetical protein
VCAAIMVNNQVFLSEVENTRFVFDPVYAFTTDKINKTNITQRNKLCKCNKPVSMIQSLI